jgi:hypothetical protein
MMMKPAVIFIGLVVAGGAAWAASQSDTDSTRIWKAEDDCSRKAFKEFPDYTADSNAKRDRAMRICLATGNLPPRADIAPPAPVTPPATSDAEPASPPNK